MTTMIYSPKDRETIDSLAAAVGFTATYIPPTNPKVLYAVIQAISGDVRFCIDGTTPTSTKGLKMYQGDSLEVWGYEALRDFLAIDDGGTAKLEVVYMGQGG